MLEVEYQPKKEAAEEKRVRWEEEPVRRSWIEGLTSLARRHARVLGFAAISWLSFHEANVVAAYKAAPEGSSHAFSVELQPQGEEKRSVSIEMYTLENFNHPGGEEKISVKDFNLALFTGRNERPDKESLNQEALDAFYASQLARPEILESAGLTPEDDLDSITPKQAALLSRALITENLNYDDATTELAQTYEDGLTEEVREGAMDLLQEGLPADTASAQAIYEKKMDIVCRNASDLFNRNFDWLKEHKGRKLRNTYARSESGSPLGLTSGGAIGHAWNSIIQIEDRDGDGVADGAEKTIIETTPLNKDLKTRLEEKGIRFADLAPEAEGFESLESLAALRAKELVVPGEYMDVYSSLVQSYGELLKEKGSEYSFQIKVQNLFTLVNAFERGARTREEHDFFESEETAVLKGLLELNQADVEKEELEEYILFMVDDVAVTRSARISVAVGGSEGEALAAAYLAKIEGILEKSTLNVRDPLLRKIKNFREIYEQEGVG